MSLPRVHEIPIGGIIIEPGSSRKNQTGGWRSLKPVLHDDRCIRCRICWMYCPEGTIKEIKGEFLVKGRRYQYKYEIDYTYCKGCGICAHECPTKAIEMVPEA